MPWSPLPSSLRPDRGPEGGRPTPPARRFRLCWRLGHRRVRESPNPGRPGSGPTLPPSPRPPLAGPSPCLPGQTPETQRPGRGCFPAPSPEGARYPRSRHVRGRWGRFPEVAAARQGKAGSLPATDPELAPRGWPGRRPRPGCSCLPTLSGPGRPRHPAPSACGTPSCEGEDPQPASEPPCRCRSVLSGQPLRGLSPHSGLLSPSTSRAYLPRQVPRLQEEGGKPLRPQPGGRTVQL